MGAAPGTAAYNANQARRYQKRAQRQYDIAATIGSLGTLAQGLGSYARQRQEQEYINQANGLYSQMGSSQPMGMGTHAPPMALYDQVQGPVTAQGQVPMQPHPQMQAQGNPYSGTLSQLSQMNVPPRMAGTHFQQLGALQEKAQGWDRNARMGELYRQMSSAENPTSWVRENTASGMIPPDQVRPFMTDAYNMRRNQTADQEAAEQARMGRLGQKAQTAYLNVAARGEDPTPILAQSLPRLGPQQDEEMLALNKLFEKTREGRIEEESQQRVMRAITDQDPSGLQDPKELAQYTDHMLKIKNLASGGNTTAPLPPEAKALLKEIGYANTGPELEALMNQVAEMGPEAVKAAEDRFTSRYAIIERQQAAAASLETKRSKLLQDHDSTGVARENTLTGQVTQIPEDDAVKIKSSLSRQMVDMDRRIARTLNPRLTPYGTSLYAQARAVVDGSGDEAALDHAFQKMAENNPKQHDQVVQIVSEIDPNGENLVQAIMRALERVR